MKMFEWMRRRMLKYSFFLWKGKMFLSFPEQKRFCSYSQNSDSIACHVCSDITYMLNSVSAQTLYIKCCVCWDITYILNAVTATHFAGRFEETINLLAALTSSGFSIPHTSTLSASKFTVSRVDTAANFLLYQLLWLCAKG